MYVRKHKSNCINQGFDDNASEKKKAHHARVINDGKVSDSVNN